MRVVLILSLLRARVRTLALALGYGLFTFVVGLSYASIDQNAIRSLVEALPPALRALSGAADLASPPGYLGGAYGHPVSLTIQGALVISMASAAARDTETGAAELILSRPIPPWRWLAAQTLAIGIALATVVAGGMAGGLAATRVVDDLHPVAAVHLATAALTGGLLFTGVAGVSLLCAVVARRGGRATGWAAGFVVVSYALNYIAKVWTVMAPLGPGSVFHRFDPGVVTGTGEVPGGWALRLVAVTALSLLAAHLLVQRRELAGG